MAESFQAASLAASPSYPNAVAWSDENLVAVATGHIVTVLDPAIPSGPRCLIKPCTSKPFPIGVVERKDLLSGCLLPICLSRDLRPCIRSLSWSPVGLAPHSGCLLAACTAEGRVKIYRFSIFELHAEWEEALDISEILYTYLASINFGELNIPSSQLSDAKYSGGMNHGENGSLQIEPVPDTKKKNKRKREPEHCSLPRLNANQYASCSAMLSSLAVSWSPIIHAMPQIPVHNPDSIVRCSILAVGAKSGMVSFWRIHSPKCYTIMPSREPTVSSFIGFLKAHNSWVTCIHWAYFFPYSSEPQLLLVTGSSDGSVKIWMGNIDELLSSTDVSHTSFSLLQEVITVNSIPVSVLSVTVPEQSQYTMLLAVGKGSGSLEVWICDISAKKFDKVGPYNAHEHVVTGFAWAFDGRCLYSCSQDNSVCGWILRGCSLWKVPLFSKTSGRKGFTDVPNVFDLCYGLAVSPGNLVLAVARTFDADLLNPMYEARTQKAAVEFFLIGGQPLDSSSNRCPDFDLETIHGLPVKEPFYWELNILWSLKRFEHPDDMPLVVWDILQALSVLQQSALKYMKDVLSKWIKSCMGVELGLSTKGVHLCKYLSKLSSRNLQLINIISRRLVLADPKTNEVDRKQQDSGRSFHAEDEFSNLWMDLLLNSEDELRARLVGLSFSVALTSDPSSNFYEFGYWHPVGVAQMEQWLPLCHDQTKDRLELLVSQIEKVDKSNILEYAQEEKCYCKASIRFESPEVAFCGIDKDHRFPRCAASMIVCPITPSWFCVCCKRRVSNLPPETLFQMSKFPTDLRSSVEFSKRKAFRKPLCPFCGILLSTSEPVCVLLPSPV